MDNLNQLQEQARRLEGEIEQRKALEAVLRQALEQRNIAEDRLRASEEELRDFFENASEGLHAIDAEGTIVAVNRAELRGQNDNLTLALRFSEMFVGTLGHDLRNPLSAISTAACLLRRRADSESVGTPAARILKSAARMSRMIDQLLDFTQIRLGRGIAIESRPSDLAELSRLAIDDLGGEAGLPRVELKTAGSSVGSWDPDRIMQLVTSLLSNAVAHGAAEGVVTLRVDGTSEDHVLLDIHNTGVVPDSMLPLLFEPYRRAGLENSKTAGSNALGLGLFISQKIAEVHAGTIDVTSSAAEGTHFVVKLPRILPPRRQVAAPAKGQPG